jgi:hypothetical protein
LQSKEQERKPLTYSGTRPISIPVGVLTIGSGLGNARFTNRNGKAER